MDPQTASDRVVIDVQVSLEHEREAGDYQPLFERVRQALSLGCREIVLDVSGALHADSVLLGAIAQVHASASRQGARIRLVRVGHRFRELLAVTKLDRILSFDMDP